MKCGSFRISQWDFLLIFGQIVSLQFLTYFTLGILLILCCFASENNLSISCLYAYKAIRVSEHNGRVIFSVFICNSILSAVLLWIVVKRAKQCLDFSCTFHGFHLLICWWYNSSFPSNISWWFLNVITSVLMCLGGEFLCLKSELNKIPIKYFSLNKKTEKSDV